MNTCLPYSRFEHPVFTMAANMKKPSVCQRGKLLEYNMTNGDLVITEEMKDVFNWDGAFVVKGFLSVEEVKHINSSLSSNPAFLNQAMEVPDGMGRASRLLLWNHPGNDVTGMVGRCEKMVNTCEELLGGEVYHYHTKLMMKEGRTGGAHIWHQDYGYWYQNGILKPDLLTVFIAMDPCLKENGCLNIVPGSQRSGRIEHKLYAGQQQADPERVEALVEHYGKCHAELEPGDALFFHSNVLHMSGQNHSDMRRWAFLCAYNTRDNNPIKKHHCPQYTPLQKVPNSAILECTETDISGKDIMDPAKDKTSRGAVIQKSYK